MADNNNKIQEEASQALRKFDKGKIGRKFVKKYKKVLEKLNACSKVSVNCLKIEKEMYNLLSVSSKC